PRRRTRQIQPGHEPHSNRSHTEPGHLLPVGGRADKSPKHASAHKPAQVTPSPSRLGEGARPTKSHSVSWVRASTLRAAKPVVHESDVAPPPDLRELYIAARLPHP